MTTLLVVAKAPVPGLAKTRLCPPATSQQAAEIAAACLLDTLAAVRSTPGVRAVVALTGDLAAAVDAAELRSALAGCAVIEQRGADFPARLAAAHADAAAVHPGEPVLQIGMDTPQLTPQLLAQASGRLTHAEAVFGPADDGGWWAIGFREPTQAHVLSGIATSRSDTAECTQKALQESRIQFDELPVLTDVDTVADARAVAGLVPHGRFAAALGQLR